MDVIRPNYEIQSNKIKIPKMFCQHIMNYVSLQFNNISKVCIKYSFYEGRMHTTIFEPIKTTLVIIPRIYLQLYQVQCHFMFKYLLNIAIIIIMIWKRDNFFSQCLFWHANVTLKYWGANILHFLNINTFINFWMYMLLKRIWCQSGYRSPWKDIEYMSKMSI